MTKTITQTNFLFDHQKSFYKGKVRDVYNIADQYLVLIATDRLSAFDVVMPRGIPYKGQILNQIATRFMELTKDIVPNWLIASPDPNVMIGQVCEPFKVEMVIRGYLAGSAAREYAKGSRVICGVELPDGLKENDKLPEPIITPSTKEEFGSHDQNISKQKIIGTNLVSQADYEVLESYTKSLYLRGSQIALQHGLLLVDTKYEFGKNKKGEILLIDEIHTPDSSRYFYADGYLQRQNLNQQQKQLSKEFVRKWLLDQGFSGQKGQQVPLMNDQYIESVSKRYIELYEIIMGCKFIKEPVDNINQRIFDNINEFLKNNQK